MKLDGDKFLVQPLVKVNNKWKSQLIIQNQISNVYLLLIELLRAFESLTLLLFKIIMRDH